MVLHLVKIDIINQLDIVRRLAGLQYSRNGFESDYATYRVCGAVMDIFHHGLRQRYITCILESSK